MKSAYVGGWLESARANITLGAPIWFVVLAALALQLRERELDRRVVLFALTAMTHLALARVGWLFRYEAWLVAWGIVTAAPHAARAVASGAGVGNHVASALFALTMAILYGGRCWDCLTTFPVSATWNYDGDIQMARYIERYWPDSVVALHDIGAVSWYADAEIVDVAGLATNDVTRLHLAHRLGGRTIGELLDRRHVDIAWTDARWLAADLPPQFEKVAEIRPRTPAANTWTSFVWAVDPDARERLAHTLAEYRPELSSRMELVLVDDVALPLAQAELAGVSVRHEVDRIVFYTDGQARLVAPSDGRLVVSAAGSRADGRGPRFEIRVGDRTTTHDTDRAGEFDGGAVRAGEPIALSFADDGVDRDGNDRNLWITRVAVQP